MKQILQTPRILKKEKDMTPEEFCIYYCGEMTERQKSLLKINIENDRFLGVGRALGRSVFRPLVCSGNQMSVNVIDGAGHYQLASLEGRIGYNTKNLKK